MRRIESTRWTLRGTGTGGTVLTLLLAALLLPGPWARAQDDDDDTDDHLYTELTKFGSEVELGFLWNADDSFQFGNYTGLERDGFYVLGNVDTMWRGLLGDDDASYLRLRGLNLGLDSRYADLEFGQQGRYGLFVEYDQLPVYQSETAETFFLNAGREIQTLPPGWVPGSNDLTEMTELDASLRQVDVDWDRWRVGSGFSLVLPAKLSLDGRYNWERKKGSKLMGAAMGLNGGDPRAQINWEPLEYVTQNFETNLRYTGDDLQLSLGYYGSAFNDENDFMRWQTPYLAAEDWNPAAGYGGLRDTGLTQDPTACDVAPETCGLGRKGLMPDNWFHQILASGGYNLPYHTRATLSTAFGWMLQDDDFLPYTVNGNLTAVDRDGFQTAGTDLAALPRTSLDGKIFTTVVDFRIASRPLERWKFDLGYHFDNRDNDTPRDLYVYIHNDSGDQAGSNPVDEDAALASGDARYNRPYSYTQHRVDFDAGYQIWRRTQLSLGYEWKQTERDYQEVDELRENTIEAILTSHPYSFLGTRLRYAHSWRDGDDYVGNRPFMSSNTAEYIADEYAACVGGPWPDSECPFENNPWLRKSYLANRERDEVFLNLTLLPLESLNVSLYLNYRYEDYDNSELGITKTKHWSPGIDVSYSPFERLSTYAFYTFERSKIEQNGLAWQGFSIAQANDPNRRWNSSDEDTTHTVGTGFDLQILPRRLDFGADYLYARSLGDTDMLVNAALTPGYPYADNIAKQHNVSVHADYHFTEHFSVRVGYLFAKLHWTDWAFDGVTATNINFGQDTDGYETSSVIGTGQRSEDYTNNVVSWSLVYTFW